MLFFLFVFVAVCGFAAGVICNECVSGRSLLRYRRPKNPRAEMEAVLNAITLATQERDTEHVDQLQRRYEDLQAIEVMYMRNARERRAGVTQKP